MSERPFIFTNTVDLKELASDHVIKIPENIPSKEALFATFAREGRFPSSFGANWDALLDCLRDLSWLGGKRVVILHESLPLKNRPIDCARYLDILSTAVDDWKVSRHSNVLPAVKWKYVDHELIVLFPLFVRDLILRGSPAEPQSDE